MATSGSTNFTLNRQQVINGALRLCVSQDINESPSSELLTIAAEALDAYLKSLMSRGPHLWRQDEGVLFLAPSQQSYDLGSTGDHATRLADLVSTQLSAAAASGATSLSVDSTTGMAVSDPIGVELTAGTRHWTTIATIPGATSLTITSGLSSAASDNATVVTYTTKLTRPLRITDARRRAGTNEVGIELISRQEYFNQANKAASGKVVMAHYAPQLTNGKLYVWPTADDVADQLRFTYERVIEDMDAQANNFDLPVEWLETVKYGLASRLCDELPVPEARAAKLKGQAARMEAELLAFDQEYASIQIVPGQF